MAITHHLDRSTVHREWNNALPPRLTIDPGDTVIFDTRDAADGYYALSSTHADVLARGPFRGHPLTGPVSIKGARRDDVRAGAHQRGDGEMQCRLPARRRDRADAAFERGDALLQHRVRRIGDPRVEVTRALHVEERRGVVGVLEDVGRRLVDRRGAGAGRGIRVGAGVDGQGVEAGLAVR